MLTKCLYILCACTSEYHFIPQCSLPFSACLSYFPFHVALSTNFTTHSSYSQGLLPVSAAYSQPSESERLYFSAPVAEPISLLPILSPCPSQHALPQPTWEAREHCHPYMAHGDKATGSATFRSIRLSASLGVYRPKCRMISKRNDKALNQENSQHPWHTNEVSLKGLNDPI